MWGEQRFIYIPRDPKSVHPGNTATTTPTTFTFILLLLQLSVAVAAAAAVMVVGVLRSSLTGGL